MLDIYANVFAYRGIERLLIVFGGMVFAYLGYRLFVYGVDKGNGKLETESAFFKLTFSGSGPGLFFMAFGALILIYSMFSTVVLDREALASAQPASSQLRSSEQRSSEQISVKETLKFAGGSAGVCDRIRLSAHNNNPNEALWVYQNGLSEYKAKAQLNAIATILQNNITDEKILSDVLLGIEDIICTLEK